MDNALARARPALAGKTGPGAPPSRSLPYGGGVAAFKDPVTPPYGQARGANPNVGQPFSKRFIPPLALFNDASQWINRLWFVRPMPLGQNPDSNPLLRAQYAIGPRPVSTVRVAAGALNLQLQLGQLMSQAARLTIDESNYFGS